MNKLVTFILWPTISSLVFVLSLLLFPPLLKQLPLLNPSSQSLSSFAEPLQVSAFNFSDSVTNTAPAVVSINSSRVEISLNEQQTRDPFTVDLIFEKSTNLGSGVIINPDGYIVTSLHIFSAFYETSTITLNDQRTFEARMLAIDEGNDLALLKIDAEDLPFITPASSETMEVGDLVLAIGNPRNVGQSVSLGIISSLLKRNDSFVIQTDAAINPGNSGGALIDTKGNLIGINSVIVSESGGSEGIGFSIPADKAISLMEAYVDSGPSGYLGVDSDLISLRRAGVVIEGLRVSHVPENSPADRAGIEIGDIILGINDTWVSDNFIEFIRVLSAYAPGDTVMIRVFRGGEIIIIPTKLGVGEPYIYQGWYAEEPELNNTPVIN